MSESKSNNIRQFLRRLMGYEISEEIPAPEHGRGRDYPEPGNLNMKTTPADTEHVGRDVIRGSLQDLTGSRRMVGKLEYDPINKCFRPSNRPASDPRTIELVLSEMHTHLPNQPKGEHNVNNRTRQGPSDYAECRVQYQGSWRVYGIGGFDSSVDISAVRPSERRLTVSRGAVMFCRLR